VSDVLSGKQLPEGAAAPQSIGTLLKEDARLRFFGFFESGALQLERQKKRQLTASA
jgi:hypothetical protein